MFKNITYPLMLATSLFFASTSMSTLAADNSGASIENSKNAMQSSMQQTDKININKATNEQLAEIKGLGPKKAQAIIDYREANGDFKNIESLMEVKGIGSSTLQKITPYISL